MKRRVLGVAAVVAALAGSAGIAGATTGISTGLPRPEVQVKLKDGQPYEGRFVLSSIPKSSGIVAGQILVSYTETNDPYLVGFAEFDAYDDQGRRDLWMANMYPFAYDKADAVLSADLLSQGSNSRLGRVAVSIPKGALSFEEDEGKEHAERLTGRLTVGTKSYDVAWRSVPEETNYRGKLPKAKLTAGGLAKPLSDKGWGSTTDVLGRYQLVEDPTAPSNGAGFMAPLVRVARSFSTEVMSPLSAELTVIQQKAQARDTAQPAGILKVHDHDGTQLVYLTDLRSEGAERTATVRGGNFNGPKLGQFEGTASGARLVGTLSLDTGDQSLELERYSSDPHP
jgi:hypothetical protein